MLAIICRSYGAYRDLDTDNYKDFAPTEHDLDLPMPKHQGASLATPREPPAAPLQALINARLLRRYGALCLMQASETF